MSYNGWTNWETWNVVLWIDNDEGLYNARLEAASDGFTAESAEQFVRESLPDGTPEMDDTDGGYPAVDWQEVAESWNEE